MSTATVPAAIPPVNPDAPTLQQYRAMVKPERDHCPCGSRWRDEVCHHTHEGGWRVAGFADPQWLYLACGHGHEYALWKLGVPRDAGDAGVRA